MWFLCVILNDEFGPFLRSSTDLSLINQNNKKDILNTHLFILRVYLRTYFKCFVRIDARFPLTVFTVLVPVWLKVKITINCCTAPKSLCVWDLSHCMCFPVFLITQFNPEDSTSGSDCGKWKKICYSLVFHPHLSDQLHPQTTWEGTTKHECIIYTTSWCQWPNQLNTKWFTYDGIQLCKTFAEF